ncbi:hypothetical protein [Geminicoccus roseus]|uniref:hypothetical protein n=1 Tax=Geminicoccus roseus TaxID=404900 RepID=UPI00040E855A|nr:hypothetical protein [Geminicoccus roseus]
MMEKLAVGEVEAAYMLGASDFAEGRRLLRSIPPLSGTTKKYSLAEIRKRAGEDQRTSQDLAKVEDALIARAKAPARAPVRRRNAAKDDR